MSAPDGFTRVGSFHIRALGPKRVVVTREDGTRESYARAVVRINPRAYESPKEFIQRVMAAEARRAGEVAEIERAIALMTSTVYERGRDGELRPR